MDINIFRLWLMVNYGMNHLKMFLQFVDGLTHGLTLGVVKSLSRLKSSTEQGQRQLGLDFIWDNGQLTWINKQLGSTIDQDKKNPLGLTINLDQQLTWIDSQLLQHIYRPIAAHLLHYCSMFKTLLQHIYGTI